MAQAVHSSGTRAVLRHLRSGYVGAPIPCHEPQRSLRTRTPTSPPLLPGSPRKRPPRLQTGLPMTAASIAAGQSKLKPSDQVVLTTQLLPWAGRAGTQCHDLMTIYYEKHVGDDLEELRQRWRIIPAPSFVEATRAA